jgi:hypothetical protein
MIQLLPAEKLKKLANELESNKHSKVIDSCPHVVTMLQVNRTESIHQQTLRKKLSLEVQLKFLMMVICVAILLILMILTKASRGCY